MDYSSLYKIEPLEKITYRIYNKINKVSLLKYVSPIYFLVPSQCKMKPNHCDLLLVLYIYFECEQIVKN